MMRKYQVGVFPIPGRKSFTAYTVWYNPKWDNCCQHYIESPTGAIAKKKAIQEHKERCVKNDNSRNAP